MICRSGVWLLTQDFSYWLQGGHEEWGASDLFCSFESGMLVVGVGGARRQLFCGLLGFPILMECEF